MRLKFLTFAVAFGFSFTFSHAQQTTKITSGGTGYLEYLPADYNKNNNNYPVMIFLHGIGERGSTSTDPTTLKNSVQKVANVGLAKYVKQGAQYPFIIISPQLKSSYGTWPSAYVMEVLNHVKKYLRIDERRIYITGLSLGGFGTWTTLGDNPGVFAAAVPICSGGSALSKACDIAGANVPLWGFHGTGDNVVSYNVTTKMINAVNACPAKPNPLAKTTLFSGLGHNIWDKVYKETNAINWMLGFTTGAPASGSNTPPVVNAGPDKSLTLPANEIYISGTASDPDGSIVAYKWTKVSGGTVSLGGATSSKLRAYNMVEGSYVFRLTVQDNGGASKSDDVKVTVSAAASTNIGPVANAGPDKSTSSNSITLYGSGSDKDGKIVSYKWEKYQGGSVTLTNATSPTVTVSGLKDGNYFLRLTVTDDKGATAFDNMKVAVKGSSSSADGNTTTNSAPVANAGPNETTSGGSIVLRGSGSDKDGKIVSYKWTQYGGAAVTLSNAGSPNVTVSNLKDGRYYLRLTVTDDKGATAYDNMMLTVNRSTASKSGSNVPPVADAGPNMRTTTKSSTIKIIGSGSDKDGSVVSYKWTQYGGPDVTLRNAQSPTVTVADFEAGKYYLKLTVKDDDGAVAHDNMLLVVDKS